MSQSYSRRSETPDPIICASSLALQSLTAAHPFNIYEEVLNKIEDFIFLGEKVLEGKFINSTPWTLDTTDKGEIDVCILGPLFL